MAKPEAALREEGANARRDPSGEDGAHQDDYAVGLHHYCYHHRLVLPGQLYLLQALAEAR